VLRANSREGVHRDGTPYAYTCPAAPRYRHQWHWDSCLHAIAWCRYDVRRAREELRTVLRGGRGDGFIPHIDGDGLITIILPDESGLDDSPKYDPVYGPYAHYKPGCFRLVARYGRLGWSAAEIAAAARRSAYRRWPWTSTPSHRASTCGARGAGRRG
jgi:hypothetical protein